MGFGKLGFVVSFLALCEHAGSSTMLSDVRHKRFTVRKPAFRQTVPVVKISFFLLSAHIRRLFYIVRIRPFGLPDARKGPEKCRLRILSATGNAAAFPAFRLSGRKSVPLCKKMSILRMSWRRFSLIFRTGPRLRTERRLRRPFGLSRSFRDYARRKRRPAFILHDRPRPGAIPESASFGAGQ